MLINEVCKECNLTKKAIEYYESQGLLTPKKDTNGYRIYKEQDVSLLKEISLLRKLDISISDIKSIFASKDKKEALANCKTKMGLQLQHMKTQYECLEYLIDHDYNTSKAFNYIETKLNHDSVIKDKLLDAFPGNYGKFICIHFGKFLDEKIDTDKKAVAYQNIIGFLDDLNELDFPKELENYLNEAFEKFSEADLKKIDENVYEALDDYDSYIEKNKETIEAYLEYKNSDEFKNSPAFKMQQLLIDFQSQSGYTDILIPNMRILSDSYDKYLNQLHEMNEKFIADHPQAKDMY